MLGTLAKAGMVLDLFTPQAPEWGVSEVAAELGVPKSSAHALLSTLNTIGLVRRLDRGRYRLGWRAVELHRVLQDTTDFLDYISHARIQGIADSLRVTMHIAAMRNGCEVIYLKKVIGADSPDITDSKVGLSAWAHCTAIGKVLLSYLDDDEIERAVAKFGLARLTGGTATSLAAVQSEAALTRPRGYAYDREEAALGVSCVAAPIRDVNGNVQAAMSITVPALRFSREHLRLRYCVQNAAMRLGAGSQREQLAGPRELIHSV